jgi:hypothetical protein
MAFMFRIATVSCLLLSLVGLASADPVREVEIVPDPVQDGQQTFDVCLTPGESRTYDKLTFVCVLHQEFPKATTDQRTGLQIHEPAVFTYRRRDVKMVEDLDVHVSFKVPLSLERLKDIYGVTTFNTNYPVTVSKMTISASVKDATVWSFEVKAGGRHTPVFVAEPQTDKKP